MTRSIALASVAIACLIALAAPAQAIYIVTPLTLHTDSTQVEVGDTVDFDVRPQNESTQAEWAGKSVIVRYWYDTAEAEGPDAPTSSDEDTVREGTIVEALSLDERATGSFSWTATEEFDDHNVAIRLEDEAGELLAVLDIAVGDAPPVMRILAGSGPAEPAGAEEPAPETSEPEPTPAASEDEASTNDVPAPGVVAGLAALGAAALALRRK